MSNLCAQCGHADTHHSLDFIGCGATVTRDGFELYCHCEVSEDDICDGRTPSAASVVEVIS